jgi:hypothetical protein
MTTTTSITGYYLFIGLPDDDYNVVIDTNTLPAGGTGVVQSGDPDDSNCSSPPDSCDDETDITLSGNNDDMTADFGYTIPNTIFGNVWEDNNGNTAQESGENRLRAAKTSRGGAVSEDLAHRWC